VKIKYEFKFFFGHDASERPIMAWWGTLTAEQKEQYRALEDAYRREQVCPGESVPARAARDFIEETGGVRNWWTAIYKIERTEVTEA
jgi:hypothetical protein